jgi:hypothetical protein
VGLEPTSPFGQRFSRPLLGCFATWREVLTLTADQRKRLGVTSRRSALFLGLRRPGHGLAMRRENDTRLDCAVTSVIVRTNGGVIAAPQEDGHGLAVTLDTSRAWRSARESHLAGDDLDEDERIETAEEHGVDCTVSTATKSQAMMQSA